MRSPKIAGHQTCKACGRRDKFNFDVPDKVWRDVVPPKYRNRVVCLACFDNFAHASNRKYAEAINFVCFAGDAATFTFVVSCRRSPPYGELDDAQGVVRGGKRATGKS